MQIVKAVYEKDNSSIGKKTIQIFKQNPVPNGYHIISETSDVLESGYYESPLGYNYVDLFLNKLIKLEKKKNFWL